MVEHDSGTFRYLPLSDPVGGKRALKVGKRYLCAYAIPYTDAPCWFRGHLTYLFSMPVQSLLVPPTPVKN
jgi:hypothetical protein